MPQWIHDRAEHLLARNPDMSKSTAFAVATQQSHAMGKSPKSYGTKAGRREAKAKYDTPKGDEHKANPGNLESEKMAMYQLVKMSSMRLELMEMYKQALAGAPPPPSAIKRLLASGKGAALPKPNPAAAEAYAKLRRQGAAPGQLFHVPPGKSPFAP